MQETTIHVLHTDLTLVAAVDTFTSFRGERAFWGVGNCELHVPAMSPSAKLIQPGVILMLDPKRVWLITRTEFKDEDGPVLTASGSELKSVLGWRLTVPSAVNDANHFGYDRFPAPDEADQPAESIFKHYVAAHATSPADERRAFPGLAIAPDLRRGPLTRWSSRFEPLTACFQKLGEFITMGYAVTLDLERRLMVFDTLPTQNQTAGSTRPVVFSPGFETVKSLTHTVDTGQEASVAFSGGAGEDEERLILQVAKTEIAMQRAGFDRKEAWLDISGASTPEELEYEARRRLPAFDRLESFTAEIVPGARLKYLSGWDVGSLVSVVSPRLGISREKLITKVSEVWERGRHTVTPTFGKKAKNIAEIIKHSREDVR